MGFKAVIGILCVIQALIGVLSQSPCSAENHRLNMARCLNAIREKALDPLAYQFTPNPLGSLIEDLPKDQIRRSLTEQLFQVDNLSQNLRSLDRFVHLKYTARAGSYVACDHTHVQETDRSFFIDPLAGNLFAPWEVREPAETTWEYNNGEFFTDVTIDAYALRLVQVTANIPGNDYSKGLILFRREPYHNPTLTTRPMVKIIYKQSMRVLPQKVPSVLFNVTDFAVMNGLEGPVGINWVDVTGDLWSADFVPFMSNCADFIATGRAAPKAESARLLLSHHRQEQNLDDLYLHLRVRFKTPKLTYACGPINITQPAGDFYVDPIGSKPLDSAYMRSGMILTWEQSYMFPLNPDLNGKYFTLVFKNSQTNFITFMRMNMRGQDPYTGDLIMPYSIPRTFDGSDTGYYVFMLYEQVGRNSNKLEDYLDPECTLPGRCLKSVEEYVKDNGLKLVGYSHIAVHFGEYEQCLPRRH